MKAINREDKLEVGSFEHLSMLLDLAVCRTEKFGIPFKREEYRWILGVNIINAISDRREYAISLWPEQPRTLFGIVIEINYQDPYAVQLWENITNKV